MREKISGLVDLLVAHDAELRDLESVREILPRIADLLPNLTDFSALKDAAAQAARVLSIDATNDAVTRMIDVQIENLRLAVRASNGANVELNRVRQEGDGAYFSNDGAKVDIKESTFKGPGGQAKVNKAEIHNADVGFNTPRAVTEVTSGPGTAGILITPGGVVFGAEIEGDDPYSIRRKRRE